MLYADDAGVVSKSPEGLTKMITVIVTVFEVAGLTVSEKKTETMLFRTPHQEPQQNRRRRIEPLVVEAAGQRRKNRRINFPTWAALSTKTPTSTRKSKDGCDSPGRAFKRTADSFTIDRLRHYS